MVIAMTDVQGENRMSREEKFLMLVQTAAIVKELSGEAQEVEKIRVTNNKAHLVLAVAMDVFQHVPPDMDIYEAANQFIEYMYSKEPVPHKPGWILPSGH
jgi:hypothetical protein